MELVSRDAALLAAIAVSRTYRQTARLARIQVDLLLQIESKSSIKIAKYLLKQKVKLSRPEKLIAEQLIKWAKK